MGIRSYFSYDRIEVFIHSIDTGRVDEEFPSDYFPGVWQTRKKWVGIDWFIPAIFSRILEDNLYKNWLEFISRMRRVLTKFVTPQMEALMRCSLERGMITQKDYEEIMAIEDDED